MPKRTCIVPDCGRPANGPVGYCQTHNARIRRCGDPQTHIPVKVVLPKGSPRPECDVQGCTSPVSVKSGGGVCEMHYARLRRHGDTDSNTPHRIDGPAERRFWAKVRQDRDCWVWTASLNEDGYGRFVVGRVAIPAHRWSYEQMVAPVPHGLELDHLCRNRACVNPDHLEPVPHAVNVRRAFQRQLDDAEAALADDPEAPTA